MGVGDRVFEPKWSELGARKQVVNFNREVRITMGAERLENRWEWVKRVGPVLRRERMISTRRFDCGEDGCELNSQVRLIYYQ